MSSDLPPCRLLARSKQGLEMFTVSLQGNNKRTQLISGAVTWYKTAHDGSCVYALKSSVGVIKIDLTNPTENTTDAFLKDSQNVQMLDISPKNTYLLTWERSSESQPNNLKLWDSKTGDLLMATPQKSIKRESWPYLQWTVDEKYAMLVPNSSEIRVYTPESIQKDQRYVETIKVPGIASMSVPQNKSDDDNDDTTTATSYYFTTFISGSKNQPAKAALYKYEPGTCKEKQNMPAYKPLVAKSLFQAETMTTHWNSTNEAALITLQTSVDATGQSYYGSSHLFLLQSDQCITVPLPQEGPVHSVAWNPTNSKSFIAIAGKMPAMASLHKVTNKSADADFVFGNAHRNTIIYAPHGRFVCLAGFGNLAGGLQFWDVNKKKLIRGVPANEDGTLRASTVVNGYGWSPDSRTLHVSTCSPRMNVDNGIDLYTYRGQNVGGDKMAWDNEKYRPDKLLETSFIPAPILMTYPDRSQSPLPESGIVEGLSTPTTISTRVVGAIASRYVPPSARDRGSTSLADRMRQEKQGSLQSAGKVGPGTKSYKPALARNAMTGRVIPGLVVQNDQPPTKKTKPKKKPKEAAPVEPKVEPEKAEEKAAVETEEKVDPAKRARKINKMLKQIDELKTKDHSTLNDDQKAKLASEADLRDELRKLEI